MKIKLIKRLSKEDVLKFRTMIKERDKIREAEEERVFSFETGHRGWENMYKTFEQEVIDMIYPNKYKVLFEDEVE